MMSAVNPADGSLLAELGGARAADVDDAVSTARTAFERYRSHTATVRARWCRAAASTTRQAADRLGRELAREHGKPIAEAVAEVRSAAHGFEVATQAALAEEGSLPNVDDPEKRVWVRRVPRGVWAVITPWNFPLNIAVEYLGPALASGNATIWKPAPSVARIAVLLREVLLEADFPEDLLQLVTTDELDVVQHLTTLWTRSALSELDRAGRVAVLGKMRAAGLEASIDAAGNVVGRLPGRAGDAGALVTGSHTDTVEGGGRFDGNVGVVAALETVRLLAEADVRLDHDLLVVDFFGEEPNRFGISCVGSRALTGLLTRADLERTDERGGRFGDAWRATGSEPADALGVRLPTDRVRAFVELHVEQGPYLELEGGQIGLVSRITGLRRFRALFSGQRDHAGTTPMDRRRDAGCAAAGTVLAVERIGREFDHSRATTGRITFTPDAVNVVSERAEIRGEFCSPEADWLQHAHDALMGAAQDESARRGVTVEVEWVPPQAPTPVDSDVSSRCEAAVVDLGLRRMRLYSGAEHDAAVMGRRFPTALLFIPSQGGRSHCPEEWTDLSDIGNGVRALAHSLVRIDQTP